MGAMSAHRSKRTTTVDGRRAQGTDPPEPPRRVRAKRVRRIGRGPAEGSEQMKRRGWATRGRGGGYFLPKSTRPGVVPNL
jgi:hypothetical protein